MVPNERCSNGDTRHEDVLVLARRIERTVTDDSASRGHTVHEVVADPVILRKREGLVPQLPFDRKVIGERGAEALLEGTVPADLGRLPHRLVRITISAIAARLESVDFPFR